MRGDYFAPWYSYTLTVTSTDGAGESHQEFLNIPIGQPVGAVRVKLAQFIDRKSASTTLHFSNDTYRSPCRGSRPFIIASRVMGRYIWRGRPLLIASLSSLLA